MTEYNKRDYYNEVIKPAIEEIKENCVIHGLPMFFAACVANNEEESSYETEIVSPFTHGIELKEDHFPQHLMVTLGFKTDVAVDVPEIDFTDGGAK